MTLVQLYKQRCKNINGKYVPTFWEPRDLPKTPVKVYGNSYTGELLSQIEQVLSRSISLNKYLELDGAAYYVGATLKREKDLPKIIKLLLQSNIKDEKYHERGIGRLARYYGTPEDDTEAKRIADRWTTLDGEYHPLWAVGLLECALFTPMLGFWRVFGSDIITEYAKGIAEDEQRHVLTNISTLSYLGYDFTKQPTKLFQLLSDTLAWMFEGVNLSAFDSTWTLDGMVGVADDLVTKGDCPALTKASTYMEYYPHFETNKAYIDRITE